MTPARPPAPGGFDRVRPRTAHADRTPAIPAQPGRRRTGGRPDLDGKGALFSSAPPVAAFGSLEIACGGCGRTSVLSPRKALSTLLPSLHLPLPRRNRSYLRCPACRRFRWCHLTLRV